VPSSHRGEPVTTRARASRDAAPVGVIASPSRRHPRARSTIDRSIDRRSRAKLARWVDRGARTSIARVDLDRARYPKAPSRRGDRRNPRAIARILRVTNGIKINASCA